MLLPDGAMKCPTCGVTLDEDDFKPMAATGGNTNDAVALFLCIFLGAFGVHKFYEGKPRMGLLYLCTMGLLGIGWIVDIIRYTLKVLNK